MFRVDKARVERAFQAYTGHFDTTNLQISNKIRHSYHVARPLRLRYLRTLISPG